ncbi:homeobox-DDT domain protein RLT2-like isoform X2 [Telopea speciosissima]|uniref:homeobox-DDT domain protein RLT2-like isoform X2 n=1 Tax=Telopea speciosissima TaxID=54955 RepID=UPI001CC3C22D|nr:homeobox-DDT domain protein RLT2-like isoform X2 [Telopea speciosissima]
MEAASDEGDKKKPPEGGEIKSKRKMKTASQLELLEKTYAVETYPSETLRAELSAKLGLTDRQLQMWFCHRRLKDRKAPPAKRQRRDAPDEMMMVEPGNEPGSGSGSGSSPFGQAETRKGVVARPSPPPPPSHRVNAADIPMIKRYYEHPQSIMELRAIAAVEAQLGEPLREDGPILGMEFDPLPPDAFGAPLATMGQPKQAARPYDGKVYERHDAKSIKTSPLLPSMEHCFVPGSSSGKRKLTAGNVRVVHPQAAARALQEYQFLPEQPSARSDAYDRVNSSHFYDSPDGPSARASSFPATGQYLHGNEQLSTSYSFQGHVSGVDLLSQQGRQGHIYPSASGEYDGVPHKNSFANVGMDAQFGAHPMHGLENSFVPSDRRVSHDEDVSRMERKRKNEEARIAREVEAHEKRIRKELEKQDLLRRKREEQMKKEMERHDRERRKEEERLMREKQKEEERFLREQKRENERREKFLQKETLRAEKMRQKEEIRREKEAARLKAANERATARRIAKESMELIEDERLELMEVAASSKALPSIISLDGDTLQNLDSFRDLLSTFPPKSVQLKRPFAIQPWTDSEENLGNLFMVWKFLINFTDVLELWPFTLDEFIQAFHDYDPRLLGEIHVALLRCIIKDIEDVARTPSMGLGANQTSATNLGGGHPQIVEGAYAWGFDIRSWQRHLNPLTWPEILRQFALSAGFGPQLKKRSIGKAYFRDDNEGHDGENIVSTLRNGAAAENAVAIMQEKGFSHPRRSRHRLTPGTVKFAAFHVLSLEGSKGLTILEAADKIQKSGLRDLTTSKTPEASIAAALSRDTKLFERTAPSTYCVRAAFRKDPADAEVILSAAREKIQIFQSGYSDSEDAEKDGDEADDVERDEDSECDAAEDPEVDDVGTSSNLNKETPCSNEAKASKTSPGNEKGIFSYEVGETPESGFANSEKGFSSFLPVKSKEMNGSGATIEQSIDVTGNFSEAVILDQEETEIDESNSGEPWVEGLTEGEYSDLSVGERLNALVALIGVAIEGNSIRLILEERLEAANSLKKQMWAEAQLDKRRMKEEYMTKLQYSSFTGIRAEPHATNSAAEGSQSPLPGVESKNSEASLNPAVKSEPLLDPQNVHNYLNDVLGERTMVGQEFPAGPDNFPHQQHGYATEKSRFQLKASIAHKAEEMFVYRSLPLGQDRRRNRYWLFVTSASRNDPGSGRIFFESHDGCWRLIDSEEAFDALLGSLDTRGIRESHLHSMLQKIETSFRETVRKNLCKTSIMDPKGVTLRTESAEMTSIQDCAADGTDSPSSMVCGANADTLEQASSFKIELGRNDAERVNAYKRYLDFEKWTWKECFNPYVLCAMKYGKKRCSELLGICDVCHDTYSSVDDHCSCCHATFSTLDDYSFSEHVAQCEERRKVDPSWTFHGSDALFPMRFRLLKAILAILEVSIPSEALQPFWTDTYRKSWGLKLQTSSSAEEILQTLTLLESCIKRDCLSSNFETTKELLASCTSAECAVADFLPFPGSIAVVPWVPQTTAAVALRLMEIDSSVSYIMNQKAESQKDKEAGEFIKLPSRYAVVKNIQEVEPAEAAEPAEYLQEERWDDPSSACMSSGRGRGGRGRGRGRSRSGRLQRGGSSRFESAKENAGSSEKTVRGLRRKSRTRGRGRKRGRRTVRSRPRAEKRVIEKQTPLIQFDETCSPRNNSDGQTSRSSGGDEWDVEETRTIKVEGAENSNNVEASESDDNAQVSGDEYDEQGQYYGNLFHGKSEVLMEESEEDFNGDNGDGDGDDGDSDEEGDGDADGDGDEGDGDGDEDEEVDGDEEGEMDGDREENGDEDQEQHVDEDEDTGSTSSYYSE